MSTQSIELEVQKRDRLGTRASRRMRRDGQLPAVVYGHQQEPLSVVLPLKTTVEHIQHGNHLFNLKLDGNSEQVLIKDVQYDHLGMEVLHVDFFRVNLDEEVHSEVPVHLIGEARGVRAGGILTQMRDTIEVVAKVRDLPDEIRINISDMEIGQALHIGEVTLPEGVKLPEQEADFTVAMIAAPKLRGDDEVATETGEEPEIINRKPAEEEEAEEPKKK